MVNIKVPEIELLIEQKFHTKKAFIERANIDKDTLPRVLNRGLCTPAVAQKIALALEVDFSQIVVEVDPYSIVMRAKGNVQAYLIEEIQSICEELGAMKKSDEVNKERLSHLETCHSMLLASLEALGPTPGSTPKSAAMRRRVKR